ncbi:DUF6804 family protein [Chitinophaga filiformis]|uniref:Uncharacterized protein n=1 Tax=Chitinophaga filiformis TaxID=104663 RepID=A0ABY4I8N6_CHIFI|nr:DUF6804 family protein [Chitinophaga filiformis]UPK72265.1 hypothetical protein MYF79_13305 [Chitinophaga filiformis]
MRSFTFLIAVLLFVAILKLPIAYYTVLRILVFICALLLIRRSYQQHLVFWVFILLVIAVIFNPILPVYLYRKSSWIPIDIAAGILFLLKAILWDQNKGLT